jgi:hypothetical protein
MKTKSLRPIRPLLAGAMFAVTGAFTPARATVTDWYLVQSNVSDQNWNNTSSSQSYKSWADSASITNYTNYEDHYATVMDDTATYHVIGAAASTKDVRTGNSTNTFGGGKLVLENRYSRLLIRSAGAGKVSTIGDLESKGGQFVTAVSGVNNLDIGTFTISGELATLFTSATGGAENNRTHNLVITTLAGDGDIAFSSANNTSKYTFSIGDASAWTGNFLLTSGALTFTSPFATAGSLTLTSGTFNLTNDITVASLSVSGSALGAGTYTAADLADFAGEGLTITGDASITIAAIPEPAQAALVVLLAAAGAVFVLRRRKA